MFRWIKKLIYGIGEGEKYSKSGSKVVEKYSKSSSKVSEKWSKSGLKVVQKWSKSGSKVIEKWKPADISLWYDKENTYALVDVEIDPIEFPITVETITSLFSEVIELLIDLFGTHRPTINRSTLYVIAHYEPELAGKLTYLMEHIDVLNELCEQLQVNCSYADSYTTINELLLRVLDAVIYRVRYDNSTMNFEEWVNKNSTGGDDDDD